MRLVRPGPGPVLDSSPKTYLAVCIANGMHNVGRGQINGGNLHINGEFSPETRLGPATLGMLVL